MQTIAIGGEPCSGKTTLMKDFISHLGEGLPLQFGVLRYLLFPNDIYVLGKYEKGDVFAGTDRLSMSVQRDAERFVGVLAKSPGPLLVFEGDRLFNGKFLDYCGDRGNLHARILWAPSEDLEKRHRARKDTQTAAFLKGRRTKYKNLEKAHPSMRTHLNCTKAHRLEALRWMLWIKDNRGSPNGHRT